MKIRRYRGAAFGQKQSLNICWPPKLPHTFLCSPCWSSAQSADRSPGRRSAGAPCHDRTSRRRIRAAFNSGSWPSILVALSFFLSPFLQFFVSIVCSEVKNDHHGHESHGQRRILQDNRRVPWLGVAQQANGLPYQVADRNHDQHGQQDAEEKPSPDLAHYLFTFAPKLTLYSVRTVSPLSRYSFSSDLSTRTLSAISPASSSVGIVLNKKTAMIRFKKSLVCDRPLWVSCGRSASYQANVRFRVYSGRSVAFFESVISERLLSPRAVIQIGENPGTRAAANGHNRSSSKNGH